GRCDWARRGRASRAWSRINRSIRWQTARHALCQQVAPDTPGAVGPAAGKEAGAHLYAELFVTPAALTARSYQPGRTRFARHRARRTTNATARSPGASQ